MKRILLALAIVLVFVVPGSAQTPPILLNPTGVITFTSSDHGNATSYRVGWFRTDTQADPDVSETILLADVRAIPTANTYELTTRTRPPFRKFVVRVKLMATTCDPGMCESPWSDPGTWTDTTATPALAGTWVGYTPKKLTGFVLR